MLDGWKDHIKTAWSQGRYYDPTIRSSLPGITQIKRRTLGLCYNSATVKKIINADSKKEAVMPCKIKRPLHDSNMLHQV